MKHLLFSMLFFMITGIVHADERILDFHSEISVAVDGSMEVTETIRVRAEGQAIKRGIFRDFPTDYRDADGNRYVVAFDIEAVRRDGQREDYHTEQQSNGVRIYIGNAERYLEPGEYRYAITYRTNRQLGFFDEHDELYWNVTGNGWAFPIDHASARVHLPGNIAQDQIVVEAYTGLDGALGKDYRGERLPQGAVFETTGRLNRQEGLTIVVSWPKGIVEAPTREQRLMWLLEDNRNLVTGLVGLLVLTVFYLLVWARVGRDPERGVIVPQYEPPVGFSPGVARYIWHMKYDDKVFTAALVSLAVKGYLTLKQDGDEYSAQRSEKIPGKDLGPGEKRLLNELFGHPVKKTVAFTKKLHRRIGAAVNANKAALLNSYDKEYFLTNRRWLIPGILITIATLIACVAVSEGDAAFIGGFMMVWLSVWSVGVFILVRSAMNAWRNADGIVGHGAAIGSTLFALPFVVGEIVGLSMLIFMTSFAMLCILLSLLAINMLFYHLLKAPTLAGRKLLDKLEGLRLYLEVAEKDELQFKHPPEKTPELFERLYPYALALDVEQRWAERFTSVFAGMEHEQRPYNPGWYHGGNFSSRTISSFSGTMGGALSSAISSASTAPGSSSGSSSSSSSGFSGGGSSGGGGGGGGGGGW